MTLQAFYSSSPLQAQASTLRKGKTPVRYAQFDASGWIAQMYDRRKLQEPILHVDKATQEVSGWACSCGAANGGPLCVHVTVLASVLLDHVFSKDHKPAQAPAAAETRADLSPLFQAYLQRSEHERSIILAAALYQLPADERMLALMSAGYKPDSSMWTNQAKQDTEARKPVIAQLVKAGLLEYPGKYKSIVAVPKALAADLFSNAIDPERDRSLLMRIMEWTQYPVYNSYSYSIAEQVQKALAQAQLAFLLGDAEQFTGYYKLAASARLETLPPAALWERFACQLKPPSAWEQEQSPILPVLIHDHLIQMLSSQIPPGEAMQHTIRLISLEKSPLAGNHAILSAAADVLILQGKWEVLSTIARYFDPVTEATVTAVHSLRDGKYEQALEQLELAAKAYRKQHSNPKAHPLQLAGPLLVLLWLRSPELRAKAEALLIRLLKKPQIYLPIYDAIEALAISLRNQQQAAAHQLKSGPDASPLHTAFRYLIAYLGGVELEDKYTAALALKTLHARGYDWIAAELLEALVRMYPDDQALRREHADWGAAQLKTPLADLIPRIASWQLALDAMMSLGGGGAKPASEGSSRLIWLVDFESELFLAKEQVLGKQGWSKGRNVATQRLFEGGVPGMTDHDRRIVGAFRIENSYYGPVWNLDFRRVVRQMVGHPLIYLMKSPEVAVQLSEEAPSLTVTERNNGYEVRFSSDERQPGIYIRKESPTRYKVVEITDRHAQLAQAMGQTRLQVPKEGSSQLKQLLQVLAPTIQVQSALDAAHPQLRSVQADPRPCIHLLPVGEGFHVEFFVKPLGSGPPYFKPGKGEAYFVGQLDTERVSVKRDLKAEQKQAKSVEQQLGVLKTAARRGEVWELEDTAACLELLTELHPIQEAGDAVLEWPKGEKFRIARIAGFSQFKLSVVSRQDWLEVQGELRVDESLVFDMQQLLQWSRGQQDFIELGSGQFLALTREFRRRLQEIDAIMSADKKGRIQVHPLAAPALQPFIDEVKRPKLDAAYTEQVKRLREAFSQQYPVPGALEAELRPYQEEGYQWLSRLAAWGAGACLADDMGLGKTIQALALLTQRGGKGPALVVAPASVCRNWLAETLRFAPALNPILFSEEDRSAALEQAASYDLIIVTYDLLARESEIFSAKRFATIILDEAQSIKNRQTKRSEAAMALQGDFRLITTGTPVENHLGELWNLFQFINPGLLGSHERFQEQFAIPIGKYQDESRRQQLKRLLQPFILRRKKQDVLTELPAKTEITLTVELTAEERAFYEALRRKALESLQADRDAHAGTRQLRILAEIMRLRRAACHPALADEQADFLDSSKLRLFGEVVSELLENGHKALVFSQFVGHLSLLRRLLDERGIAYQYLDGQTPLKTRQQRIDAFQAGEGDLFLISLKAGGAGLNLTAADYVIHMDPWWNPAVEDQASDRVHRIGQQKPVTVYRIVAAGTIEEKILQLHATKRDLADSLLEGTETGSKLNADELLELLQAR